MPLQLDVISTGLTVEIYREGEHKSCFLDEFVMTEEDVPQMFNPRSMKVS